MLDFIRRSGLKTKLRQPIDAYWDHRLGVNTFGWLPAVGAAGAPDWRAHYVPTPYVKIFRALRRIELGPRDVFVDLGCGLGRAVFAASALGAGRAVGVEIDADLVAQARENHRVSRLSHRDIEFVCTPAQAYSTADSTVIFMFHPFGAGTLAEVVTELRRQVDRRPRPLRIVYENPVHADVLDGTGWLRRIDEWPQSRRLGGHYPMAFWQAA